MKQLLLILVTSSFGLIAQASESLICGPRGMAMFNSQNAFECHFSKSTCETQELLNKGYFPSATGKCPTQLAPMTMCGWGGAPMQHPTHPEMVVNSLSTCETNALREMGWIPTGL